MVFSPGGEKNVDRRSYGFSTFLSMIFVCESCPFCLDILGEVDLLILKFATKL